MGDESDIVLQIMRDYFTLPRFEAWLIVLKLRRMGSELPFEATEDLVSGIELQRQQSPGDDSKIPIPDGWVSRYLSDSDAAKLAELTFDDTDYEALESIVDEGGDNLVWSVVDKLSQIAVDNWRSQASAVLATERAQASAFASKFDVVWGVALTKLEMLISISYSEGATFNRSYRPNAARRRDYKFEALTRLHARGILVSREIVWLLSKGFADGAYARCRTLYEITIITLFIRQYDSQMAEKYLLHAAIREHKEHTYERRAYRAIGFRPPRKKDLAGMKRAYRGLLRRYGKRFEHDYGWAEAAFPGVKGRIGFSHIEAAVNMDHYRLLFQQVSEAVHAGARGIAFQLGNPLRQDILLAGPSIYGIADPGRTCAYLITLLTVVLLTATTDTAPLNSMNVATANALRSLQLEVHTALGRAERKVAIRDYRRHFRRNRIATSPQPHLGSVRRARARG